MKLKYLLTMLSAASFLACTDEPESGVTPPTPETPAIVEKSTGFMKGADVSWLTEMEANNILFYNAEGTQTEGMSLLKGIGVNAIRLRVWVNPADGWCNKSDLLVKALRAQKLGMRIMVDFHYSDEWADPSKQKKPAAWDDYTYEELVQAVADHTTEVLTMLKNSHIEVEYVQVGNETGTGMLKTQSDGTIIDGSDAYGDAGSHADHYAELNNAGYNAAKAVYPDCKVIVHIQNGQNYSKLTYIFDKLNAYNALYDVIGVSLYPDFTDPDWHANYVETCLDNLESLIADYNKDVMICEIGGEMSHLEESTTEMNDIVTGCKAISRCLGVFYWEPQCCNGWKSYAKGAFNDDCTPSTMLNAFAN